MKTTHKTTKADIDAIFKDAQHQSDVAIALYRLAVDFDKIKNVGHFPKVNNATGEYMWEDSDRSGGNMAYFKPPKVEPGVDNKQFLPLMQAFWNYPFLN